jgi:hypothetical protein
MLMSKGHLSLPMKCHLVWLATLSVGCSDPVSSSLDTDAGGDRVSIVPDIYSFENEAGDDTVSYSGQTARHLLVWGLDDWISGLTVAIDNGSYQPDSLEAVIADLDFYFDCEADLCSDMLLSEPGAVQQTLAEISVGKNLVSKLAGNDPKTDHQEWTSGAFVGWPGAESPEALIRSWFDGLSAQAFERVNGELALDPNEQVIDSVALSPEGLNRKELIEKFLLGGVAFSQGADDYLDSDVEGKGLLASHSSYPDGSAYTELEHAWDEGFGYFGASRSYPSYTDEQLAAGERLDTNGDELIDLGAEVNYGHSVNAGKRDFGASTLAPTDFSRQAWEGFAGGRQLLADTAGAELSEGDFERLSAYRDQAVSAWESAIAATAVHYINEVLMDTAETGSSGSRFVRHAKHWSELKGFALGLQFNPRSPLSDADFILFHELIGVAPVLETASSEERSAYRSAMLEARSVLGAAYGFDEANLGDAGGEGGW